ncbi:hypothetical protein ACIBMX_41310 [Streptomyces phaeochromogenes]|uniref:hypothetical protein n=1 Tax=Streptomyces phaeochromogenes TaxID=1923 RepID=UPI0033E84B30
MADRYEELRAAVAEGTGEGWRLGRGVLVAKGMASWAAAWRSLPTPPARPSPERPPALSGDSDEVVRVLAAMALAHLRPPGEPPADPKGVEVVHGRDRGGGQGDPRASAA